MFVRFAVIALASVLAWAGFVRPSEGAGPERVYVVAPADTLWSIAVRTYPGDPREGVWKLQQRNGLEGTLLVPGQRLVLPPS